MIKPFLSARWHNLFMANYEIDPGLLMPHVPRYTELDLFNGQCLISLVAFQFLNTRIKGFRIPWHVNFPEINLRYYLKRNVEGEHRRGVGFLAEIVPRHAITFVANTLFNEHYKTRKMSGRVAVSGDQLRAEYSFTEKGRRQTISCVAGIQARQIHPNSLEDFITEHYFGYNQGKQTLEYKVEHPSWRAYPVQDYAIAVDFAAVYGKQWGFLTGRVPHSVLLAEGSEVNVYSASKVTAHGEKERA